MVYEVCTWFTRSLGNPYLQYDWLLKIFCNHGNKDIPFLLCCLKHFTFIFVAHVSWVKNINTKQKQLLGKFFPMTTVKYLIIFLFEDTSG